MKYQRVESPSSTDQCGIYRRQSFRLSVVTRTRHTRSFHTQKSCLNCDREGTNSKPPTGSILENLLERSLFYRLKDVKTFFQFKLKGDNLVVHIVPLKVIV